MREQIIVAIDKTDWGHITHLGDALEQSKVAVKIGMELFYAHGPKSIEYFHNKGLRIFLDLKLHDIPNTVGKAIFNLCQLPVFMLNVHAAGGSLMMKEAHEARLKSQRTDLLLIAVTQLTSTSQEMMNRELNIPGPLESSVLNLARLTQESGLDGVVCSAQETLLLKQNLGSNFKCVTPGIRPSGEKTHDQVRVMTPSEALKAGSDFLVIGRAITEAHDPRLALENIIQKG